MKINPTIPTPYYLIDKSLLQKNLQILSQVKQRTKCKILLAQKAFSCHYFYPLIAQYLDGTTASGLHEARLGKEKFGGETHVFSPAFRDDEIIETIKYSDHIVFNSPSQVKKFLPLVKQYGKQAGLRINPEHSTQEKPIYDPCSPTSRLGTRLADLKEEDLEGLDGLHMHTLCEQNSDAFEETLREAEQKFSKFFKQIKWFNFGGGHHITRDDYDIELLVNTIIRFKEKYNLDVYLEPGEAVVLNSGFLVSTVLDIVNNSKSVAILDTSAACHMPDVLEMPYTPPVMNTSSNGKYPYQLSSNTCLAGDIIGDYNFDKPLSIGDNVIFKDMALYTIVKNNTFNGINLPSIVSRELDGSDVVVKTFGYDDFVNRLS